ncbi:hypothetical protein E1B28_005932 [Marasmius oreades]|uniref:Uncharacterized protein n=1 Tax=Marasmius oreades TaxID=181124 RepID=A0A9P7S4Q2_9AGAR|nr:uncharacterized protein E1B28_005932 [Marasmius oreades]KAG7095153.1 hypothetical protein E1B28_005932 [Marasmius oreades]
MSLDRQNQPPPQPQHSSSSLPTGPSINLFNSNNTPNIPYQLSSNVPYQPVYSPVSPTYGVIPQSAPPLRLNRFTIPRSSSSQFNLLANGQNLPMQNTFVTPSHALLNYGAALWELQSATSGNLSKDAGLSSTTQIPFSISTNRIAPTNSTPIIERTVLPSVDGNIDNGGVMSSSSSRVHVPTRFDDPDSSTNGLLEPTDVPDEHHRDSPPHMSQSSQTRSHNPNSSLYVTRSEITELTETLHSLIVMVQHQQHPSNEHQHDVTQSLHNSLHADVRAPYPDMTLSLYNSPGMGMGLFPPPYQTQPIPQTSFVHSYSQNFNLDSTTLQNSQSLLQAYISHPPSTAPTTTTIPILQGRSNFCTMV